MIPPPEGADPPADAPPDDVLLDPEEPFDSREAGGGGGTEQAPATSSAADVTTPEAAGVINRRLDTRRALNMTSPARRISLRPYGRDSKKSAMALLAKQGQPCIRPSVEL